MYEIIETSKFKKDLKLVRKRGYDLSLLGEVVNALAAGEKLDASYWNHKLIGGAQNYQECHLKPDWLLIYSYVDSILYLIRTGTHSDLF